MHAPRGFVGEFGHIETAQFGGGEGCSNGDEED
jgi:hypothetical protein